MDKIDEMDPRLSQEMASEYMDAQKNEAQIALLERRVEKESHGFENIDAYTNDKMLLDSLKAEQAEETTTASKAIQED
tara:strand:+ start:423 stop:656 length:234 start_codon:yes stop_codon:yes gene_type:complete